MPTIFFIALGGAFGAVMRHLAGVAVARANPTDFPLHTLIINVVGSFLIGVLVVAFAGKLAGHPEWRTFLIVGVLGGFTTFSAFSLETMLLVDRGQMMMAAVYVAASVLLSLLAVFGGAGIARVFLP